MAEQRQPPRVHRPAGQPRPRGVYDHRNLNGNDNAQEAYYASQGKPIRRMDHTTAVDVHNLPRGPQSQQSRATSQKSQSRRRPGQPDNDYNDDEQPIDRGDVVTAAQSSVPADRVCNLDLTTAAENAWLDMLLHVAPSHDLFNIYIKESQIDAAEILVNSMIANGQLRDGTVNLLVGRKPKPQPAAPVVPQKVKAQRLEAPPLAPAPAAAAVPVVPVAPVAPPAAPPAAATNPPPSATVKAEDDLANQ